MDGCFGLCRKQKKGNILGTPKHGTILFADQDDVDNFVNSYGKAGADTQQVHEDEICKQKSLINVTIIRNYQVFIAPKLLFYFCTD
jgi:hypothetical protein